MTSNIEPIPMTECLDRHCYRIVSRNLVVGVYKADHQGFVGIRMKFDSEFLFTEYHHDTGPPTGTARAFVDLGLCPIEDLAEYHHRDWQGDGTDPEWASESHPYGLRNEALFSWLQAKEEECAVPCRQCGKPYFPSFWNDDGHCMRTACWDSRCKPCPTCQTKVLDSDGTKLCEKCEDPEKYEQMMAEARARLDAEQERRRKAREESLHDTTPAGAGDQQV